MFGLIRETPPEDRDSTLQTAAPGRASSSTSSSRTPERSRAGRSRRVHSRGFTLIEILVTVAIISIALLITVIEANKTFKRQNLAAAAQEIENVLQQAPTFAQKRNRQAIIRVTGRAGSAPALIEVFSDENESGAIEVADRLMLTYTLPPTISFFACGTVSATGATCAGNQDKIQSANWSNDAVDNTVRMLRIDYQGRTVNPATSSQIGGVATLNVSHVDMAYTGGLVPGTTYQIRINPVWHVSTNRIVWGP